MITVTLAGVVQTIFFLLLAAGVIGLLFYLISICPIPEPYKGWIFLALKILVVVAMICFLLQLAGVPIVKFAPATELQGTTTPLPVDGVEFVPFLN